MNIWSNCSSNCRCVVFIQPLLPPRHQQHLHPARSPQQELGQRQASNASISFLFFYPHLSLGQLRRFMFEPLIPARRCQGNTRRSGSRAEEGSPDPSLQQRWDQDAVPLPSSHRVKQLQRKTVKRSEEEQPNLIWTSSREKNLTAFFLTTVA